MKRKKFTAIVTDVWLLLMIAIITLFLVTLCALMFIAFVEKEYVLFFIGAVSTLSFIKDIIDELIRYKRENENEKEN